MTPDHADAALYGRDDLHRGIVSPALGLDVEGAVRNDGAEPGLVGHIREERDAFDLGRIEQQLGERHADIVDQQLKTSAGFQVIGPAASGEDA